MLGLGAGLALGRSRLALAAGPAGEARLVVVILRGALDGLAAVPAYGDPAFAGLRGDLAQPEPGREEGVLDLGGHFGLHPRLAALHGMYRRGEALVLHAVAGPTRSRSHFEAQDCLESGADQRLASGWLNRALAALPARPGAARNGLAVGVEEPLLLRGPAPIGAWAPQGAGGPGAALLAQVAALNAADPVLGPAFAEGMRARGFAGLAGEIAARDRNAFPALAGGAGRLLAAPDGPRVAALELGGWDTHAGQRGRLNGPLGQLDAGLAALREGLGPAWRQTAVLVATEFGRTVRVNGTGGTDHGTAGAAFLLGGAVAGGRVVADWPGLGEGRLHENRDLAPTMDLRAVTKALLAGHLGLPPAAVARAFPGSEGVAPLGGLLRA
nr:DUF1501 domain-containing protein [Roseomonas acroporae]